MSKTKPEIAKAILERRNRMTHVIMPGEINAEIGPDGVREALDQRWLVPDTDSGFLCATNDLGKIEEMRALANMKPEEYKVEPILVPESHDATLLHTKRQRRINEIAAPMTGGQSPGLTAVAQPNAAGAAAPAPSATSPTPPPAAGPGKGGQLMTMLAQAEALSQERFRRPFNELAPAEQEQISSQVKMASPTAP
jgi:hypothetical protein